MQPAFMSQALCPPPPLLLPQVADFLDFVVEIKGRLRDPVTGLLAPSYRKALGSKKAGGVLTSGSETGVV